MVRNYVVRLKNNGVKRITLQRTICSLIWWKREVLDEYIHLLFQNQLWLENKVLSDPGFDKKFGNNLRGLSEILKGTGVGPGINSAYLGRLRKKMSDLKGFSDFVYPLANLATNVTRLKNSYTVGPYRSSGVPTNQLPPKAFIGRGYRDKGTVKDPAIDGSPSWQEVAGQASELERLWDEHIEYLAKQGIGGCSESKLRETVMELSELHRKYRLLLEDPGRGSSDAKEVKTSSQDQTLKEKRDTLDQVQLLEYLEKRI